MRKPAAFLITIAVIVLIMSLDLNGLWAWLANEVSVHRETIVTQNAGERCSVDVTVLRRTPFGNTESFVLSPTDYSLSVHPADSHSKKLAAFADGGLLCGQPAILDFDVMITLQPNCVYRFAGSRPKEDQWQQIVVVDRNVDADWISVDVSAESSVVQRHLNVIRYTEFDGNADRMVWSPDRVATTDDATYLTDATMVSLRGTRSLGGRYFRITRADEKAGPDNELPPPPVVLGSPASGIWDGQWILAGGESRDDGYDVPQRVFSFSAMDNEWMSLPVLPDNVFRPVAVGDRSGELVVLADMESSDRSASRLQTLVLRKDTWVTADSCDYSLPVGDVFVVCDGFIATSTQSRHAVVKHLSGGYLQTVALVADASAVTRVVVIDNRVLLVDGDRGVYELSAPWGADSDSPDAL